MPKDQEPNKSEDDDILDEARKRFSACQDAWSEVKAQALDDLKFSRLGEQWPMDIIQSRKAEGRPALTINRLPAFIRQVVNECRQNRPQIKVRPMDSGADVHTAKIIGGVVKHIEAISDADIAYDTAIDNACSMGFGFMGIDIDYACDDSFDMDLKIRAFPNPLALDWDPNTEAADSSDWNYAFVSEMVPEDEWKREYPGKEYDKTAFVSDAHLSPWYDEGNVRRCEYYERVQDKRQVLLLSNGEMVDKDKFEAPGNGEEPSLAEMFALVGITPTREREVRSYRIIKRLISGKDILEKKEWRGSIIPIVPVYGEQVNVEGRRYFYSLINAAKDSQRVFNYSRSAATEMISLAPKVPYIGPKGAFKTAREKWITANQKSWPFIEYDGQVMPQRQGFGGVPEGPLSEAAGALEDMKQIIGISNPSLGMPDTRVISGKAKRMERAESDTSTFNFPDNLARGICCLGKILVELIPQVYSSRRVIRIIGEDGKASNVPLGQKIPQPDGTERIYDLTVGKYDVKVDTGPSYATQREETQDWATAFVQAFPPAAPILGPIIVKMSDFPDSDKVTAALETLMPPAAQAALKGLPPPPQGPPPEVAAAQAKAQADMAINQQKAQQDFQLEQQRAQNRAQIEQTQAQADIAVMQMKANAEIDLERQKAAVQLELKRQEAELSAQLKVIGASRDAQNQAAPGVQ